MTGQNILSKAAATVEMTPTNFKTGSDGFRGQGKVIEDSVKSLSVATSKPLFLSRTM